jgi:RHS repeat-associated protein
MYELNNHLSNVLATVNDKKNAVELSGTGTVDFFTAEVMTANDYYPFGMTMPGRKYNSTSSSYRYGFQNQELDNELWGGAISFSHRVEDPRLGRFFSVDPLTGKYPYYTPYSFSGNQVIAFVELEGLEQLYYHLKFDANTGEAKLKYVGQTDRWFLPDLHKVYLEDYPGVAFTFSNNPFAGANNYYIDFEEFKKDPIAGINKFKSDGQILSETVQEVILAILLRRATKTNKPYQPKRLQQDVALGKNKKAPAALNTQGRTIGKNTNQNKAVQDRVAELKKKGATDIRVDQQQVDADGNHVGVNRPDLQYTLDGKRHYVEWDTPSSNRGPGHEARIKANDPKAGTVELITLE